MAEVLYKTAVELLTEFELGEPLRLVGLTAYDFDGQGGVQLDLFEYAAEAKRRRLETAMDQVVNRFGRDAVRRLDRVADWQADAGLDADATRNSTGPED